MLNIWKWWTWARITVSKTFDNQHSQESLGKFFRPLQWSECLLGFSLVCFPCTFHFQCVFVVCFSIQHLNVKSYGGATWIRVYVQGSAPYRATDVVYVLSYPHTPILIACNMKVKMQEILFSVSSSVIFILLMSDVDCYWIIAEPSPWDKSNK